MDQRVLDFDPSFGPQRHRPFFIQLVKPPEEYVFVDRIQAVTLFGLVFQVIDSAL